MIWGDQHNPRFFDYFAEKRIMGQIVDYLLLDPACPTRVKQQIIQTLSILISNTNSEMAIFLILSNNHVNDLIVHNFDFSNEELLSFYISFLKTLSLKLNTRTIYFFFNEWARDFPLYSEVDIYLTPIFRTNNQTFSCPGHQVLRGK
jgi:protein CLEC16A